MIAIRGNPDSATGRSRQANCTGSPSVAMAAMAAYRLSGRAALGAAHGPFSGSPPCSLAPGCACWPRLVRSALRGSGPVADRCRPAPACATRRSSERWSPDRQRLGNGTASGHWIENLAAELLGITLRHGHGSFDGRRDQKSNKPTPYNPGHISLRTSQSVPKLI